MKPNKRRLFTTQQIDKFITDAPNEKFLSMKAMIILKLLGKCRQEELRNLKKSDVVQENFPNRCISVTIPNFIKSNTRSPHFNISEGLYFHVMDQYIASIQHRSCERFFEPFRHHQMDKVAGIVARFLELDPEFYAGGSIRNLSVDDLLEGTACRYALAAGYLKI